MAGHDGYTRYTIRIPTPLYERLKEAAGEKSVNAEIVERLENSIEVSLSLEAALDELQDANDRNQRSIKTFEDASKQYDEAIGIYQRANEAMVNLNNLTRQVEDAAREMGVPEELIRSLRDITKPQSSKSQT